MIGTRLSRQKPAPTTGIVHLGLGAFFRAHGAVYIAEAMAKGGDDWGVTGVSLRSPDVRDRLQPHDNLYSAVEVSAGGLKRQTIDVIGEVLVGPEDPEAVLAAMADPGVKIVSLTVTEKGYCRGADGIDLSHPDIEHDLTHDAPRSAPGFIVRALQRRRAQGLRPFTVLSLDNLPANGVTTAAVVCGLAEQLDPGLAGWIRAECCFPSTMVDRIVPATTPNLIARLDAEAGLVDPAAVFHEPFRQWVIEDHFVEGLRPDWGAVSAQMVQDVAPFEHMKLRMLNGTHSALAYLGLLRGHETVAQAIADPELEAFIDDLWAEEIAPSIVAPPGIDLTDYAKALKGRYQNPEIHHQLVQIAMDGSQKMPQRILAALFENRAAGRPFGRLMHVLAGWIGFLQQAKAETLHDPLAEDLLAAVTGAESDAALVENLLKMNAIFGPYPATEIASDLTAALERIPS